jgi:hypothetical protein
MRHKTLAAARWALLLIVRAFFNDAITVALWTGLHVCLSMDTSANLSRTSRLCHTQFPTWVMLKRLLHVLLKIVQGFLAKQAGFLSPASAVRYLVGDDFARNHVTYTHKCHLHPQVKCSANHLACYAHNTHGFGIE